MRKVRKQEFHLVGEHAFPLQINVFCMRRYERNGEQLHPRPLGRTTRFTIVAALAGSYYILPRIIPALAERENMIA